MFDWKRLAMFCAIVSVATFYQGVYVSAQRLPQSPYGAPSALRGLDLAPANPLMTPTGTGAPGMDSILLTPRMFQGILPQPSNLQVGYLYSFGNSVSAGRLTLDYLLPVVFGNSAFFGEAHTAFQDFWKTVSGEADNRVDVSLGGGYRTLLNDDTLIGVNGFFDGTRLGGRWYSSGSAGFEMDALVAGNDAIDLNFNWYGNLFNTNVLANAFRRGPQNYDFQAGFSHELWSGGPDLRLSATGYRFSSGDGVYGLRGGVELKSRDGMLLVKYEAANDRVNKTYHTIGGFVNVGVRLANLLHGESPFVMPEPLFRSPRNLRRILTDFASRRRNAGQPGSIVIATSSASGCANPLTSIGSVSVGPGFSSATGVFIPFSSGLCYDRDFFLNQSSITLDFAIDDEANASGNQILGYLATDSGDVATQSVLQIFADITATGFSSVNTARAPSGAINGIFVRTVGSGTWSAIVSNITLHP